MANTCYTTVKFYGDKEEMNKLGELMDKVRIVEETKWAKEHVESGRGSWLGSIALAMGYAVDGLALFHDEETGSFDIRPKTDQTELTSIRGFISLQKNEIDSDDPYVMAEIRSSWIPPRDLIETIESYCDVFSDWIAEEGGNDIYINTDPDIWEEIFELDTAEDCHYPGSEEELLQIANDEYGLDVNSYEELEAKIGKGECADWRLSAYKDKDGNPWYLIRREQASAGNA